jgi:hypothetical protein
MIRIRRPSRCHTTYPIKDNVVRANVFDALAGPNRIAEWFAEAVDCWTVDDAAWAEAGGTSRRASYLTWQWEPAFVVFRDLRVFPGRHASVHLELARSHRATLTT